jgi:hypothetical protein
VAVARIGKSGGGGDYGYHCQKYTPSSRRVYKCWGKLKIKHSDGSLFVCGKN